MNAVINKLCHDERSEGPMHFTVVYAGGLPPGNNIIRSL